MMAENKWVVDGHHYMCPDCKKTIAIVVNESDEGFEFCPFCGKRMSGKTVENNQLDFWIRYFRENANAVGCIELDGLDCCEVLSLLQELADRKVDKPNKMEAIAKMFGKKLNEEFKVKYGVELGFETTVKFTEKDFRVYHLSYWGWDNQLLVELLVGKAVIIDE